MASLRATLHRLRLGLKYAWYRRRGRVTAVTPRFTLQLDTAGMADVGQVLSLRKDLELNRREPHLLEACFHEIPRDAVVVEIGTWIGHYAVLLARHVAPRGRLFCFDPDPAAVRQCLRNLELNGVTNATVLPLALSHRAGSVTLYTNKAFGNSGSTLLASNPGAGERIEVPCVTLDAMLEALEITPQILKIDVEGAEGWVLDGARRTIARPGVKVLVEVHGAYLRQAGESETAIFQRLAAAGKTLHLLDDHPGAPYRPGEVMDPQRPVPLDNFHILAK